MVGFYSRRAPSRNTRHGARCFCCNLTPVQKKWTLIGLIASLLLGVGGFLLYWFLRETTDLDNMFVLGRTVSLNEKNIYELISGGITVFPESMRNCYEKVQLPQAKFQISTFSSEEEMSKTTSAGLGVSFTRYGLSGTLHGVYNSGANSASARATVLIDYFIPRESITVCMKNSTLDEKLIRDLESLPEDIANPRFDDNWQPYKHFLSVYGSHVVNGVDVGARVVTWIVQKKNHQANWLDMKSLACLQYNGLSNYTNEIEGCASFAKSQQSSSVFDSYDKKVFILGGSRRAREALLNDYNPKNLQKFIESASSATPARYTFMPIWTLLRVWLAARNKASTKMIKILTNLEGYYDGYKNSNCRHMVRDDGHVLREFIHKNGGYACHNRQKGCLQNSDCRYANFHQCRCINCIEYVGEDKIPTIFQANTDEDAKKNGCHRPNVLDLHCHCFNDVAWEEVWHQPS